MPYSEPNNVLTRALVKRYASLKETKRRREEGLFMAQGTKCVVDTLGAFELEALLCTQSWWDNCRHAADKAAIVKKEVLNQVSTLSSVPDVIAVYRMPAYPAPMLAGNIVLALDCVQDPGNLGTIMRVADWMGVTDILASKDTADVWSPKVVQATMGAIARVRVHYVDLPQCLGALQNVDIYGTFLDGEDIYKAALGQSGIIVMGNEGNGIGQDVERLVNKRLTIPSYPPGRPTSESLNVAVATAITLSEFRRNG